MKVAEMLATLHSLPQRGPYTVRDIERVWSHVYLLLEIAAFAAILVADGETSSTAQHAARVGLRCALARMEDLK